MAPRGVLAIAACGTVNVELAAAGVPQVIYGWIDINVYIYLWIERESDVYVYVISMYYVYKPRECCMWHRERRIGRCGRAAGNIWMDRYQCIYIYMDRERDVYIYVCIYLCIYKPRDCCVWEG